MAAPWRTPLIALPLVALPLLALAACDQTADNAAPAEKRAEGEVLGGTISDEMIPLDQLRSQSPPMRVVPSEGGDGGADGGAAPSPDDETPSEAPAAAEESAPAESADEEG